MAQDAEAAFVTGASARLTAGASPNDHDRIVRAFLVEEAKIVKRVLKQKATSSKTSKK